jgi:hypothetical protein
MRATCSHTRAAGGVTAAPSPDLVLSGHFSQLKVTLRWVGGARRSPLRVMLAACLLLGMTSGLAFGQSGGLGGAGPPFPAVAGGASNATSAGGGVPTAPIDSPPAAAAASQVAPGETVAPALTAPPPPAGPERPSLAARVAMVHQAPRPQAPSATPGAAGAAAPTALS